MSTPTVVHTCEDLRRALRAAHERASDREAIGFVPTMGALHEGHMQLIDEAARRTKAVVVSIFVNPTQFGPNEDFARYPRDLSADLARCAARGVAIVFAPEPAELYPPGDATRVRVDAMAETLCGPVRPNHFVGVATVVAKLFALVAPCVALFGRKDYQQLKIIERMATDLRFDVDIIGVPTVRDADGLAMSSRNAYLSTDERERARALPRALARASQAYASGERRAGELRALAAREVHAATTDVDYVALNDAESLAPVPDTSDLVAPTLLAIAARIGKTRLIDNVVLGRDPAPIAARVTP